MSFVYVRIPADSSEPIEELTASKAGGLEDDELIKHARSYFQQQAQAASPSCDIMALSIPSPKTDYKAVSLYSNDYGTQELPENPRATQLVTSCGHTLPAPLRGDVFVGRAHDNEAMEWERVDFTADDAEATADWCRVVRTTSGGRGAAAASSLNSLVQQQLSAAAGQGRAAPQIVGPSDQGGTGMYGLDGSPAVQESWGSWTQSDEEVELKLVVPAGIKGKDCDMIFKRNQLKASVAKEVKVEGSLFAAVVPDECTYTIESLAEGRELCITLTKADEGCTWSWLVAATK